MPGTVNSASHPLNPSRRTSSWQGTWKPVGQLATKVPFSPLPTAQVIPIHALAPPLFSTEPVFPPQPSPSAFTQHPSPIFHSLPLCPQFLLPKNGTGLVAQSRSNPRGELREGRKNLGGFSRPGTAPGTREAPIKCLFEGGLALNK